METALARRHRLMGTSRLFYDAPVHIVRGEGVWLWDDAGRRYLDAYNNVPVLGHAHPAVAEAVARQTARLATHSRYLSDTLLDYLDRLTGALPGMESAVLTCTGSEANDLALRAAHALTGATGIVATAYCYHGNTKAVSQLNATNPPFDAEQGNVARVFAPDSLRPRGGSVEAMHTAFTADIHRAIADLAARGRGTSCLMLCPILTFEGLPTLPKGFFDEAVAAIRAAGGIVIADEVQAGFGRTGALWGFEHVGLTPDIVTMGKAMGNGYPVAGLATRADLLARIQEKIYYFNTFAANPVAAAAGMAVLDTLAADHLPAHAARTGAHLAARLRALPDPGLADIRNAGLFVAAELVRDPESNAPDPTRTKQVVEGMRHAGILLSAVGPSGNILKIRPPLPFSPEHADLLADTLADVLAATPPHDGPHEA
ncbi:MAG: aminotransferase class III-fold pyridoxal phosphate-dependent enzyme [Pseudomonadota bacterium]